MTTLEESLEKAKADLVAWQESPIEADLLSETLDYIQELRGRVENIEALIRRRDTRRDTRQVALAAYDARSAAVASAVKPLPMVNPFKLDEEDYW